MISINTTSIKAIAKSSKFKLFFWAVVMMSRPLFPFHPMLPRMSWTYRDAVLDRIECIHRKLAKQLGKVNTSENDSNQYTEDPWIYRYLQIFLWGWHDVLITSFILPNARLQSCKTHANEPKLQVQNRGQGSSYPMQASYLFQVGGVGPQESGALAGLAWKLIGGWNSCVSFACGLFPRVASSNGWLAFSCWSHNRSSRPDRWLVFISFAESSKAGWFFVRLRSNWVKMDKIECDYRATSDQSIHYRYTK